MLSLISVILIGASVLAAQAADIYGSDTNYIGRLPEVVVTAPRYEGEDMAYSGMLPEIVITAPRGPEIGMLDEVVITETRYEGEDIAYSGMLPETVITAKRDKVAEPVLTLMRLGRHEMPIRITDLLIITRLDLRKIGYLN